MNWIDASKQLPPANKNVLAIQKTGYKDNRVTIVANWIDRFTEEAEDIDFSEYSEEKDEYYLPSGWYENQYNWGDYSFIKVRNDSDITYWMLLPEKP